MSEHEEHEGRWASRPVAAWAIKIVAWVTPIAVSAISCYFIAQAFPRPRGLIPAVIWFVALSLVATGVLFAVDKVARRLLPLAALLNLSLVFPDRAPSRFKSALRTSTVNQLSERVEGIKRTGLPDDPTLAAETLIELVAELSRHDRLTRGHAERVRAYTRMIGEELKLDEDDLDKLQWAGLLHDTGKLFVPAAILNKPGRLTDEEFEVIKGHPGWGAQLCEPLRGWLGDWVDAVGQHHERWDGAGYPDGLAGEDISLAARVVSVADVYDVITSVRSYKSATSAVAAREELARNAGTQFDAHIVRTFLNISLGRLRLAMGPLSWLAQLPIIGRVPIGATAGTAASVAATGATLLAAGVLGQPTASDTYTPFVEAQEIEETITPETVPLTTLPPPPPPTTLPPATLPATTLPPTTLPPTTLPPATVPPTTATPATTTPPAPIPNAVDDVAAIVEGTYADIDVGVNDANAATATVTTQPAVGLVSVISGTLLRYTPPADWSGTTTFRYTIDNGNGTTDTATVTVTVTPLPDPPVAIADTAIVDEDGSVTITALANDSDADGDPLTIVGVSSIDGTPTTDGTTITYTPAPDTNGAHTVTYTIDDGTGLTDTAAILVAVSAVADVPAAVDDTAITDEDVGLTIAALANDSDADGDALTIIGVSSIDGTPTTDGTTITYLPAPDSNGIHTVTYTIDDGTGLTDTATITITVNPTPDTPVATDDTATTDEDTAAVIAALANDSDADGDPLTIAGASSTDGSATTDGTTVTYLPAPDSNGIHTVTYTIDDGTGLTDTATITITVNPTPDTPVATDDTATTDEDTAAVIAALANDSDPNGDPITITGVSSTDGSATTDGTTIDYTPAPDTWGTHTVGYTIDDGNGNTDTAIITVTVNPIPDNPVANDDTSAVDEDASVTGIAALTNDTDADGDTLTITGVSSTDGTPTTDGTTIDYTPAPDTWGTHTVTYTIDDGTGLTDTATITITVNPIPDAPVANDNGAALDEDTTIDVSVLLNDFDVDGDPLTVVSATSADGIATTDGTTVTYAPAPDSNGTHTVTYTIDDGTGLTDTAIITVTVNPIPDNPVANDDTSAVDEDASVTGIAALTNDTDADGDTLTITGVSSTDGTPTTDGTTIDYTPAPDTWGTHTVTYTIDDGTGNTDTATITITVNPIPDNPVATDDTATLDEDASITGIAALTNDTDADGDTLTITGVSGTDGTPTTDGTTIDYTPAPGTWGTHTVTYTIDDDTGLTDTAAITITVNPIPDAPVAADDGYSTPMDVPLSITAPGVLGNDSDEDGDPLAPTVTTPPTSGGVVLAGDGSFVYTPNPAFVGTDGFVYQVDDGTGRTDTATVTIDVLSTLGMVISEFSNVGNGPTNDFVELYNASAAAIDIEGWTLVIADDAAITQTRTLTGPSTLIPPGGHYLLASGGSRDQGLNSLDDSFAARLSEGPTIHDEVGTRARNNGGSVAAALWAEGTGLPPLVDSNGNGASWERMFGRNDGNCQDTDDNSADFTRNFLPSQANPQRSNDPVTPCDVPVPPPPPTHLVISEYRTDGPNGGQDEFVEIFNPTSSPISLAGYELWALGGGQKYNYPAVVLAPGQHYLVGATGYLGPTDGASGDFTNGQSVQLWHAPTFTSIDVIAVGGAPPWLPRLDGRMDQTYERRFSGCMDTDIWLDDVILQASPSPETSSDPATPC